MDSGNGNIYGFNGIFAVVVKLKFQMLSGWYLNSKNSWSSQDSCWFQQSWVFCLNSESRTLQVECTRVVMDFGLLTSVHVCGIHLGKCQFLCGIEWRMGLHLQI